MIVAVTGGTGFIGRALVARHLGQGDSVRLLSRRRAGETGMPDTVKTHPGDLSAGATDLLPFVDGADVLYHCAGEILDPARMRALHVDGTGRLAAAAAGRIGHWVQLSSVGAYGPRSAGVVTEDSALEPVGIYERTKAESDRLVSEASEKGAFSVTILRPSILFGPRMPNRSLFQMISMIDRGRFFFIGRSGASANYIHVDNVVEGLVRCGSMPEARGRSYNLSDHRTLEEFVSAIADALGKPAPTLKLPEIPVRIAARIFGRIPGFPLTEHRLNALVNRTVYPAARIRSELGYAHPVSMEEGLRQLVREWKRAA